MIFADIRFSYSANACLIRPIASATTLPRTRNINAHKTGSFFTEHHALIQPELCPMQHLILKRFTVITIVTEIKPRPAILISSLTSHLPKHICTVIPSVILLFNKKRREQSVHSAFIFYYSFIIHVINIHLFWYQS